jgi:SRSO17 transposase
LNSGAGHGGRARQTSDLEVVLPELEQFHQRFGQYLCRSEGRFAAERYLGGSMLPIERRKMDNSAEQVGVSTRRLKEFISDSPWDDCGCIDGLQRFVAEHLGEEAEVLILDDTAFPKKGICSTGVGRQYSGTLGRTDTCQVGVLLAYASSKGHTLVDRRLYVFREWFEPESSERRWGGRRSSPSAPSRSWERRWFGIRLGTGTGSSSG